MSDDKRSPLGRVGQDSYAGLPTERSNPRLRDLDTLAVPELVDLIHEQDHLGLEAVGRAREAVSRAVTVVADALELGGRLIYVGAGTSGRLATLDAAECPPTFGVAASRVVAVMAGGARALRRAVEGAEDSRVEGRRAVRRLNARPPDVVCGVSASGVTPFVLAALAEARRRGCRTMLVTCGPTVQARRRADVAVCLDVGPEALAGSTRMKSGLATKAVLHTLTTSAMIRLGKVHDNLMVDVRPTSRKLWQRALRIVVRLTGVSRAGARRLLLQAGSPRVAVVMHHAGVGCRQARALLARHAGRLRPIIGEVGHDA